MSSFNGFILNSFLLSWELLCCLWWRRWNGEWCMRWLKRWCTSCSSVNALEVQSILLRLFVQDDVTAHDVVSVTSSVFVSWRFMWSDRWSDRAKLRSHSRQRKGLSPVCLRTWRVSSSERANSHWHVSYGHLYGFSPAKALSFMFMFIPRSFFVTEWDSPVWIRWCAFRWELFV